MIFISKSHKVSQEFHKELIVRNKLFSISEFSIDHVVKSKSTLNVTFTELF
jgi:hypothetical protein